jgi:predicted regulator of Ras-like GTPase activity (Roadblock/LC7/MglB family)
MAERSRTDVLVACLRELQTNAPGIDAAAVVSVDGLTIASTLPQGVEDDRVSAMSAAMLSLGERIAGELGRGDLHEVYLRGQDGYVVLRSVGDEAVLTVLAGGQARIGWLFFYIRRAAEDLIAILEAE